MGTWRWNRIGGCVLLGACVAYGGLSAYEEATRPPTRLMEYRKEVARGESVWSICAEIATDKEDLNRLVWQTMKDNGIQDPGRVPPGMLLVVRVSHARGEDRHASDSAFLFPQNATTGDR